MIISDYLWLPLVTSGCFWFRSQWTSTDWLPKQPIEKQASKPTHVLPPNNDTALLRQVTQLPPRVPSVHKNNLQSPQHARSQPHIKLIPKSRKSWLRQQHHSSMPAKLHNPHNLYTPSPHQANPQNQANHGSDSHSTAKCQSPQSVPSPPHQANPPIPKIMVQTITPQQKSQSYNLYAHNPHQANPQIPKIMVQTPQHQANPPIPQIMVQTITPQQANPQSPKSWSRQSLNEKCLYRSL